MLVTTVVKCLTTDEEPHDSVLHSSESGGDDEVSDSEIDDDLVFRESAAANELVERARALVDAQAGVVERITHKAAEVDFPDVSEPVESASPSGKLGFGAQLHVEHGPTSRHFRELAASLIKRQVTVAECHRRRQVIQAEEEVERERVARRIRDRQEHAEENIRERMRETQRRHMQAQQRRKEQQKRYNENAQELERVWEKQHTHSHQSLADNPGQEGCKLPLVSKRSASDGSLLSRSGVADEAIYKSMLESHAGYATKIENWRHNVYENEQRTDEQWRKKIGRSYGSFVGRLLGNSSQTKVQKVIHVKRVTGQWTDDAAIVAIQSQAAVAEVSAPVDGTLPCHGTFRHVPSEVVPTWEQRKKRCDALREEQARQRDEKWQIATLSMEAANRRKDEERTRIQRCATQRNRDVKARSRLACQRRQVNDAIGSAHFVQKEELARRRREDNEQCHRDELAARAAQRDAKQRNAQVARDQKLRRATCSMATRLQEKEEQAARLREAARRSFEESVSGKKHIDNAVEKNAKREAIHESLRSQTFKEMQMKHDRSEANRMQARQGTLQRLRSERLGGSSVSDSLVDMAKGSPTSKSSVHSQEWRLPAVFKAAPIEDIAAASPDVVEQQIGVELGTTGEYLSAQELEELTSKWNRDLRIKMEIQPLVTLL
mmetsp:Transcript_74530/g.207072  ORF Transcript_74530/g.207072 Transcript_74530/m.207072 type:complete len:663 (+) Transcript_74530:46-2034(+)